MTEEEKAENFIQNNMINCIQEQVEYFTFAKQAYLAGLHEGQPKWHKLDWDKDFPDVDKLVRVRTFSGAEYICETYAYQPMEDEIGYGTTITQFGELNGDWVDDNEIAYWCEIPQFKE